MRAIKLALAGAIIAPAITAGTTAQAATSHKHGVLANYGGQTIDLSSGWHGAKACAVLGQGEVECFASRQGMHDAVAKAALRHRLASVGQASLLADCGGQSKYLAMFSGTNYSGTEIDVVDSVGWLNLGDYGFDNTVESWVNGKTCSAVVADGTGGSGPHLTLAASSKSADMGSWNNRASSVLVNL